LRHFAIVFLLYGFSDAVAFLADLVPVTAVPQGVNYWVFVLGVAR
jgi:hypothetical protein